MNGKPQGQHNGELADWLKRTMRKLRNGDLPPESWEQRYSPLDDSAAQRRIAALIAEIAERPREKEIAGKPADKRR